MQSIGNTPKLYAVVPFYLAGAFFFLLLSLFLLLSSEQLLAHYFQPHLLAIVHTGALGWGTMIIFGAAHQLLPVICARPLYSLRLAFCSFVFLLLGSLCVIYAFWNGLFGAVLIIGGSLVLIAGGLYTTNVVMTLRKGSRQPLEHYFMLSSAFWLLSTLCLGVLLAINLSYPFLSTSHLEWLKIHAHIGLGGWFLQLITGVSLKLVPMFLLGKSTKTGWLRWAFYSQNIALLLFFVDSIFFGITPRTYFYYGFIGVGILAWLAYLWDTYRHRIKRKIDIPMRHTGLAFLLLLMGFAMIPFLFQINHYRFVSLYGVFLFLGWITSLILGQTFKTLPFIIWNDRYKTLHGKQTIPLPKQLYSESWVHYQFWLFIIAFITLALGLILAQHFVILFSLILWLFVALLYVGNVLKIIVHQRQKKDGN